MSDILAVAGFFLVVLPASAYLTMKLGTTGLLMGLRRFEELHHKEKTHGS